MAHEKFEGERTLMRIHIGESDKWHRKPLYEAIVELLRKESFSGVTVLRGVAGYGGRRASFNHTKIYRFQHLAPPFLFFDKKAHKHHKFFLLSCVVVGGRTAPDDKDVI